jgi:hypothetical protein
VKIAKPILKSLKKRLNWIQEENINKLVQILTLVLEMFKQGKQMAKEGGSKMFYVPCITIFTKIDQCPRTHYIFVV